jgi:hypothetical protein
MKPKIEELYNESHSGDANVFDPNLFANKILKLCQSFAVAEMRAYNWQSYDDMDDRDKSADSTAVVISGRINSLIDER